MARLDLHTHSTYSDGVKPPEWVVRQASANGAELISLTDHDTLAGVEKAQAEGRQCGVRVIAGVEIGVNDPKLGELHVLGYFPDRAPLADIEPQLSAYRVERETRAERTVERLAELGLVIEYESVVHLANGASIGRPHIARALVDAGHVESVPEAFDCYLHNDGPAYIPRTLLSLHDSVLMIHEAGGFASLAHPTRYADPQGSARAFAESGGDGLEIYYRSDGPDEVANGSQLARQLGLTATVGSDFHGLHPDELRPATVSMPDFEAVRMMEILRDLSI
jgi:hypothetical protein